MKERRLLVLIAVGAIVVAGAFLYTRSQSVDEPVVPPPPAPTVTTKTSSRTSTGTKTETPKTTTAPATSAKATTAATATTAPGVTSTSSSTSTPTTTTLSDTKSLPANTRAALAAGNVALVVVASETPPEDRELTKVVRRFAASPDAKGVAITYLTPQKVAQFRSLAETITRTPAVIVLDSKTSASVNEGYIEYQALVAMVNRKKG